MPLGIVIARILIVSGMGFSAAFAIFFLVGALWLPTLVSIGGNNRVSSCSCSPSSVARKVKPNRRRL